MDRTSFISPVDSVSCLIASGQSVSPQVNLGGLRLCGIVIPAVWTAAALTFQMSPDGGTTWSNVYDSTGTEVSLIVGAGRFVPLPDLTQFAGCQLIKVRSGTSVTPVAQAQDSTLQLVVRSL